MGHKTGAAMLAWPQLAMLHLLHEPCGLWPPQQAPHIAQPSAEAHAAHAHAAPKAVGTLHELIRVLAPASCDSMTACHAILQARVTLAEDSNVSMYRWFGSLEHQASCPDPAQEQSGHATGLSGARLTLGMVSQCLKTSRRVQPRPPARAYECYASAVPHRLRESARHLPVPPHMSQGVAPVPRHSLHSGMSSLSPAAGSMPAPQRSHGSMGLPLACCIGQLVTQCLQARCWPSMLW